ncbi:MAG: hypothetical protein IT329_19780 [Caldilineaceae bacterium]|nr:hypothetical protein [Caldilineaceae bacterium]
MTFIAAFPIYPPEFAWMREADSGRPALALREPGTALKLPPGVAGRMASTRVGAQTLTLTVGEGWANLVLPSILDHELVVVE